MRKGVRTVIVLRAQGCLHILLTVLGLGSLGHQIKSPVKCVFLTHSDFFNLCPHAPWYSHGADVNFRYTNPSPIFIPLSNFKPWLYVDLRLRLKMGPIHHTESIWENRDVYSSTPGLPLLLFSLGREGSLRYGKVLLGWGNSQSVSVETNAHVSHGWAHTYTQLLDRIHS